eukprot:COSAG02_NODE_1304_length_13353_cov_92.513883_3_plen_122_part_00
MLGRYVSVFMKDAFEWTDEIQSFETLRVSIGHAIERNERRSQGTSGARQRTSNASVHNTCVGCAQFMDPDCFNSNYTLFSECNCGGGGCDCVSCCSGHARSACCGVVAHSPGCGNLSHVVR